MLDGWFGVKMLSEVCAFVFCSAGKHRLAILVPVQRHPGHQILMKHKLNNIVTQLVLSFALALKD